MHAVPVLVSGVAFSRFLPAFGCYFDGSRHRHKILECTTMRLERAMELPVPDPCPFVVGVGTVAVTFGALLLMVVALRSVRLRIACTCKRSRRFPMT